MGAALAGVLVLAVLGFQAQHKNMESLRESSQEIIYWTTSQGEAELARFIAALGRYANGDPDVSVADVNRRFDILWSRVVLFTQGDVGRRIRIYDSENGVIAGLDRLLLEHEDAIVNLAKTDAARISQVLSDFGAANERMRELSIKALQSEQERLAGAREAVRSSARLTWVFSMAALVLAFLLIGIMLIETRRYRRMAEESSALAARAEAASQAKSRFLTMMSHELRTPMNGVLGLLALVRQTALNERQLRLIDQAERSGRQMSALLGDILDFSDLQSDSLVMARDMFELRSLADTVEEMFGPIVQREGVALSVEIAAGAPRWVVGDLARLRQTLGHFVTFFVDVVGSKDVRLAISSGEVGLVFDIDVAVQDADRPGWQPEAVFGRMMAKYGDFASDSLGPMIARRLVDMMGGSVALDRPVAGRASLSISVPLETIEGAVDCVRVEADAITVQAVLGGLLRKLGRAAWDPATDSKRVSAILIEAGSEDEDTRAALLRSQHPEARLIAIGTPREEKLFDVVCPQPVTAEALTAAMDTGARTARFEVS